ncbi:MAG: LytTR family DNA-binding domain-containing protein [Oscillospiraceae bacterium]
MLDLVLCDDDPVVLKKLALILDQCGAELTFHTFLSAQECLTYLHGQKTLSAAFLDIEIGERSGIALADEIKQLFPESEIIFMTGYSEKYIQSVFLGKYSCKPFGFLTKPINDKVVHTLIGQLVFREQSPSSELCMIRTDHAYVQIRQSEVLYFDSLNGACYVKLADGRELKTKHNLSELQALLCTPNFLKVHKSYVVNMDRIKSYSTVEIVMEDGHTVFISRKKQREIRLLFHRYWGIVRAQ